MKNEKPTVRLASAQIAPGHRIAVYVGDAGEVRYVIEDHEPAQRASATTRTREISREDATTIVGIHQMGVR